MNPIDVITKLFSVNPAAARFLLGGMAVLAAAAIVLSWQIDTAEAGRIAMYILGFAALVVIGSHFPGKISRLAAWLMFGLFSLFAILFTTQFLCSSCLSPPVPNAGCLLQPLAKGCGVSLTPTEFAEAESAAPETPDTPEVARAPAESEAVVAEDLPREDESPTREIVTEISTALGTDSLAAEGEITRGLELSAAASATRGIEAVSSNSTVYIQFAGSLTRTEVIDLASKLGDKGWNIQGASEGGERLVSAYGLSEVRFFRGEDESSARALAHALNEMNLGIRTVKIRDLSGKNFKAAPGQLEVWISK